MPALDINELKAFLKIADIRCSALISEFNAAATPEEKNCYWTRWEGIAHEAHALRRQVAALERQNAIRFSKEDFSVAS